MERETILEKIKLITTEEIVNVENNINEKFIEHISNKSYEFEAGKVYGLVGEIGEGGEFITELLSGRSKLGKQKVYIDGIAATQSDIEENGWYMGKKEYSSHFPFYEISVKKALEKAIQQYHFFNDINEVIDMFSLKKDLIDYKLSYYSGERFRASLAIGYACKKNIFCFPWMNSENLYYRMESGKVYYFFEELKKEKKIIIIPTSKEENVRELADEIIKIDNPSFKHSYSFGKPQDNTINISLKGL